MKTCSLKGNFLDYGHVNDLSTLLHNGIDKFEMPRSQFFVNY